MDTLSGIKFPIGDYHQDW